MGAAISLHDDFDAKALRRLAKTSKDANQCRLSLPFTLSAGTREEVLPSVHTLR